MKGVMMEMKIAVRYQSRGGNTKAVAELIAKTAGVAAEPYDVPVSDPVDLLFIGGGVYGGDIDKNLKASLKNLNPETVTAAAAFSTAGGMNGARRIAAVLKTQGIIVREEILAINLFARNHTWFGGKGSITLSDKEIKRIEDFVQKLIV
jgi:flavodoxin